MKRLFKKRLGQKKGFTLVECIVAMAVLVIMSLLLSMILNVAIIARNRNVKLEQELDGQVENLAEDGDDAQNDPFTDNINFESGGKTFSIPGNGSDYVKANKKYYESENEIGIMDYDFSQYFANLPTPEDLNNDSEEPDGEGNKGPGSTGSKCGVENVISSTGASSVNIKGKDDIDGDGNHTMELTVDFTSYYSSPERALRIILPIGAEYIGCSDLTNCVVDTAAQFSVRIQPSEYGDRNSGGGSNDDGVRASGLTVKAKIIFKISGEDYDNYYRSTMEYFTGISGAEDGMTVGVTL